MRCCPSGVGQEVVMCAGGRAGGDSLVAQCGLRRDRDTHWPPLETPLLPIERSRSRIAFRNLASFGLYT